MEAAEGRPLDVTVNSDIRIGAPNDDFTHLIPGTHVSACVEGVDLARDEAGEFRGLRRPP